MNEQLTRLAIQACTDFTARPVLGDAVLELKDTPEEWWSPLVVEDLYDDHQHTEARARNLFFKRAAKADKNWCRSVAACLWFGHCDWAWPFPWTELAPPPEPEWWDLLKGLYPDGPIPNTNYAGLSAWLPDRNEGGTLFGLNRTKLADQTYVPGDQFERMLKLIQSGVVDMDKALQIAQMPATPTHSGQALANLWDSEIDGWLDKARGRAS